MLVDDAHGSRLDQGAHDLLDVERVAIAPGHEQLNQRGRQVPGMGHGVCELFDRLRRQPA